MKEQPTIDLPATTQKMPVQTAPQNSDSMLSLVERAARDPSIDVGKMERLLELAEKVQARKAEAEYDAAMNAAQSEMRPVAQDSDNPQTRSRYASYTAMDGALRPIYTNHGFSLSFGTKSPAPDRVTITCRVSHRAGHTEKVEIDMPSDGKGAKGNDVMTKTHATGSAVSYGMRYLLKMIFNVAIGEYDDDGNAASPRRPVERSAYSPPQRQAQPIKAAPSPKGTASSPAPVKDEEGWRKFLAACKTRLLTLIVPDDEWAWWKYAVDKGWILNTESLSDATPDKMFEGYDPKNIKTSIGDMFDAHCTAVKAMASNCPPEFREEVRRGFVLMPRDASEKPLATGKDAATPVWSGVHPDPEPAKSAPKSGSCPFCSITATTKHDDLVGVRWCQKCGVQWQDGSTVAYEEHEWMFAKLPFAPKDPAKDYKGLTLGQIARLDNRYWFGIVSNFKAEPFNGRPPSAESVKFGEACEEARKHLGRESTEKESKAADGPDDHDDIRF